MAFRRIKPLWMESSTGGGGGLPLGTTTDQIPEGIVNLYFSGKTSDDLPEGTVNLFFTDGERLRLANDVELIANKSDDIFLDSTSDIKYPTVSAVVDYVDSIELGLLDDRGNWDASGGTYPTINGSGPGGTIAKGDIWYISVAGNLGGYPVYVGDSVRALTDTPGQDSGNWDILNVGLGYIPEDVNNKSIDIISDSTSDTMYPSVKAVVDYVDTEVNLITLIVDTKDNILASTPTKQTLAYATDSTKLYLYDNNNWNQLDINFQPETGPDMGVESDSYKSGYGNDFITDKLLANCAIGSNATTETGAIRVNQSSTPDTFEIYLRDAWYTIVYDLTTEDGDFRHSPISESIYVWRGDSVAVGLNGQPIIQEYQVSMGAYPGYRVINGGTF